MRRDQIFRVLIFVFFILLKTTVVYTQQCGFPNDVQILPIGNSNFNGGNNTLQIKVKVLAVLNEDGSQGVNAATADTYMADVAGEFLQDYNIKLNYCIKEIKSDYFFYNLQYGYPRVQSAEYTNINLALFNDCIPGVCGAAALPIGPIPSFGWSVLNHKIIMHELGHILGLPHTHNNENNRDESCLTNPSGCAETVQQRNCNPNGNLTCNIEGDGFCDTPADRYTAPTTDRCGISFPSPPPLSLQQNYMSYYGGTRIKFSNEQKYYMHFIINQYYSSIMGEWEEAECLCGDDLIVDFGIINSYGTDREWKFPIRGEYYRWGKKTKISTNFYDFENIIVEDGDELILEGAKILPDPNCKNSVFKGITVKSGGHLIIRNSKIFNADYGIIAENGSTVEIDGLEIYGRSPYSGEGIRLNGNVNLINATNIKIDNFRHGIIGWEGSTLYNIKTGSITNTLYAIDMSTASVILDNFTIENTFSGIRLHNATGSMILNNKIGYSNTGIQTLWSPNVLIENNEIGFNNHFGNIGVRLSLSHGSSVKGNYLLKSTNTGIDFWNTTGIISKNDIDIYGIYKYSGGISLKNSTGCQVINNYIDVEDSSFGIESLESRGNNISNNSIVVYSNSAVDERIGAIRLNSSMDETIVENIIDGNQSSSGIVLQNSSSNKSICNLIHNSNEGIGVFYNSEEQDIKGNELGAAVDLAIRSAVGLQPHHGNKFFGGKARANELDQFEWAQSTFTVNPNIPGLSPTDIDPPTGWFQSEGNLNHYTCDGSYGPGWLPFGNDPSKLCAYWTYLKSIQTSRPELFFIKLYHLLKYYKTKNGFNLPNCIKLDPVLQTYCGLTKLVDVSIAIDKIGKVSANTSNLTILQSQYIQEQTEASRAALKYQIATEVLALAPTIASGQNQDSLRLDSIETELNTINCTQIIVTKWKEILKLYVKFLRQGEVAQNDRSALLVYSAECSDMYGDAIHLARAMANTFDDTYFDTYDGCLQDGGPRTRKETVQLEVVNIYPNPTSGKIYFQLSKHYNGQAEVYNLDGKRLKSLIITDSNINEIDVSDLRGLLNLQLRSIDGSIVSKKIIVLK